MAAGDSAMNTWYRLTPDSQGNYVNGTWSTLPRMNYTRLYYSSDVLTNGKVFVAGAEYGTGTNSAEIYDPIANTWTSTPPPPAGQTLFYDSISKMLANGNVLVAPVRPATSGGTVIYVTASNSWATGGTLFRGTYQDEASWVKLPDDSILTIDPFGVNSERYIPSSNQWVNDAAVPVSLYDSFGFELGSAFLLPNGKAFYLGSTGNTALYTPSGNNSPGSWQAGPVIPNAQGTPDAPAAMMVNGNILCAVSPVPTSANHFPSPTSFYEYDPVANAFSQVYGPSGTTYNGPPYVMRMLDLPDGSVLLALATSQLYVYKPAEPPLAAGKPAINTIVQNVDGSFHMTGTLFNGISEGAAYGDDAQMDSNYPLVRVTNLNSSVVTYLRTFGWNSTSVMTGNRVVSSEFSLVAGLPADNYALVVVANGNASEPISFSTAALPPVIVTQPQSQTALAGANVTFKVAAAGTPLTYSWQLNGSPIAGATGSSFTTNNVQLSGSGGQFSCVVSNINGSVTSSNAVLTVLAGLPPIITTQPANQSVPVGGSATFSVVVSNSAGVSYFWKRNGNEIAGANASSYTTNNVQAADSGAQFSCLLSNAFGTTPSSSATLTVVVGPSNDLCSAAFVITNSTYTMTESTTQATTNGDPTLSCISGLGKAVWFVFLPQSGGTVVADTVGSSFDTGLGAFTGACGALTQIACDDDTGGNLTSRVTNSVVAGNAYYYLAGGYNGGSGNLTFHLNFTPASPVPAIVSQPQSQSVPPGTNVTFSVAATGASPLTYFWRRNGSPLGGPSTSSYTINNVQLSDSATQFSCLVSNAFGTALSSNATLTVVNSLVPNGGFELGNFTSWTSGGNFSSSAVTPSSPYVHSGTYGARLGPVGGLGYLWQTLPTMPGQVYLLSFWLYANGNSPNEFQVNWDGGAVYDAVDYSGVGWINMRFVLTASSSATIMQFGFQNDPSYFGLDDVIVSTVPTPTFQGVTHTSDTIFFTWNSVPGVNYQLQYETDFDPPGWVDLGPPIQAAGTSTSSSDSIGPDPQRFYRVIIAP